MTASKQNSKTEPTSDEKVAKLEKEIIVLRSQLNAAEKLVAQKDAIISANMQRELRGRRAFDMFLEYFEGSVDTKAQQMIGQADDMTEAESIAFNAGALTHEPVEDSTGDPPPSENGSHG